MDTLRIAGRNIAKNDWVIVAYTHPSGPILGHCGRVMDWTDDPAHSTCGEPTIRISTQAEHIVIPRSRVEVCELVDGPHLTSRDLQQVVNPNVDLNDRR